MAPQAFLSSLWINHFCWSQTSICLGIPMGGPVHVEVPYAFLSMTAKLILSGSNWGYTSWSRAWRELPSVGMKIWCGNGWIPHRGRQWSDSKWRWCSLSLISYRNVFKPWKVSLMFVTWQVFILVRPVSASAEAKDNGELPPCWCHTLVIHWQWTTMP